MTRKPNIRRIAAPAIALVGALACQPPDAGSLPAPPAQPPASAPVSADFLGADACSECHAAQYDTWKSSTHGRAGGPPTRERVIAPFNSQPIRFRDAQVTPQVTANGTYTFTVAQANRPALTFAVAAVVGGGFMAGGGTQTFFTTAPDGTLRYLPFDYSHTQRRWICSPRRAAQGWLPITPAVALADCGDWPPTRLLGSSERFQSCQQCHGSQIEVAFDTSTRRYQTRFTTLAINCEACHGPGRTHVALTRSGELTPGRRPGAGRTDIGFKPLATLTKDQSLQVCFQCHAVKAALEPGYLSGKAFEQHYALKLPLLLDTIYQPDGRTRLFGYQEGHLASDCYLNGSMTCVDCHDPHTQRYRDINGSPLRGRFSNEQCLGCHPSKAEPLERHTRHPAASPGSRCVSCHMPYLQQPNVGRQVRYARSDHAIPIPRPAYDNRLGVEVACQQCHRDQTVQALEGQVTRWYGELKPHPPAVAAALAARGTSDARAAARMILGASRPPSPDRERGTGGEDPSPERRGGQGVRTDQGTGGEDSPWAEFVGLTEVIKRYAQPDMAGLDEETREQLERRATSTDPDIQALALATLHLTRGTDPPVRRFLAKQLRGLGSRDRLVRNRWVWILTVRGNAYLASGDYENALAAYRKAEELRPGDAEVLRNLGVAYTRLRDYPLAIEQFRKSLRLAPADPQVLIGLGFALMQQGDLDAAIAAHRQAVAASPWDPAGYANLGVAYMRQNVVQPAIEALERAVALDPGLAAAHFVLADAYAREGRRQQAVAALERGLEFDPRNAQALRMLAALRR